MSFLLIPVHQSVEAMRINSWNWRPTVELIGTFELIDPERLELMLCNACCAEVTAGEAIQVADRIEKGILSRLSEHGRLKLDMSVTTEPDDFVFYTGVDVQKNYSATVWWLRQFKIFCRNSGGFSVV